MQLCAGRQRGWPVGCASACSPSLASAKLCCCSSCCSSCIAECCNSSAAGTAAGSALGCSSAVPSWLFGASCCSSRGSSVAAGLPSEGREPGSIAAESCCSAGWVPCSSAAAIARLAVDICDRCSKGGSPLTGVAMLLTASPCLLASTRAVSLPSPPTSLVAAGAQVGPSHSAATGAPPAACRVASRCSETISCAVNRCSASIPSGGSVPVAAWHPLHAHRRASSTTMRRRAVHCGLQAIQLSASGERTDLHMRHICAQCRCEWCKRSDQLPPARFWRPNSFHGTHS